MNYKKAFTLIELVVVIVIISILAAVVVLNLNSTRASARYTRTYADMKEISTAAQTFKAENGRWPANWITRGGTGYTDELVTAKFNGSSLTPPCSGARYAFISASSYTAVIYFPVDSSAGAASIDILGTSGDPNIANKSTKQITCKETSKANFN